MIDPRTPVIVGVGQSVGRMYAPHPSTLSAADLAAVAARHAASDAGVSVKDVQAIAAIRTFADSLPLVPPFGKPDNFPRAVARRLAIDPPHALLAPVGGHTPVAMLGILGDRIARGELKSALLVAGEAIATERRALENGTLLDWAEHDVRPFEDLGAGLGDFIRPWQQRYGLNSAALAYGLCETARRARLGIGREEYAMRMASLLAPFTRVAVENPFAMDGVQEMDAAELAADEASNRMIAEPYRLRLVARDRVNQGAALLLMSAGEASARNIPQERWLFVHGLATAAAPDLVEREDMGRTPEAVEAIEHALDGAGATLDDIAAFDFYSCFPIAVFAAAIDGLGLAPDDPRQLTAAGGLPAFGGPGNGYSLHAIASLAARLRAAPAAKALVVALGGFLSKFAASVISARPAPWPQSVAVAPRPARRLAPLAAGVARLETYTIAYARGRPVRAIAVGQFANGERVVANEADQEALSWLVAADPLGAAFRVDAGIDAGTMVFERP